MTASAAPAVPVPAVPVPVPFGAWSRLRRHAVSTERGSYRLNRAHGYVRLQSRAVRDHLTALRDTIRDAYVDDGRVTEDELPDILLHLGAAADANADLLNVVNLLDERRPDAADAEVDHIESRTRRIRRKSTPGA